MNIVRTTIVASLAAVTVLTGSAVQADSEGCTTVDYQGAPLEMCPPREPDPTNCYTGDYQGAPIEICLPTGEKLPEGTTYRGAPVVYHVSKDYVPPVAVEPAAPVAAPAPVQASPTASPTLATDDAAPLWVAEYVALLGW